jgi:hypothetical protein
MCGVPRPCQSWNYPIIRKDEKDKKDSNTIDVEKEFHDSIMRDSNNETRFLK